MSHHSSVTDITPFIRYTYCVTFSALIIVAGDLTAYWNLNWIYKALLYAFTPLVLLVINALPVNVGHLPSFKCTIDKSDLGVWLDRAVWRYRQSLSCIGYYRSHVRNQRRR